MSTRLLTQSAAEWDPPAFDPFHRGPALHQLVPQSLGPPGVTFSCLLSTGFCEPDHWLAEAV